MGEEIDDVDDADNDDDLDDDNQLDDLADDSDSFDNMRKKKTRTVFSRNQVFQLESTFDMKRYLSSSERSSLAQALQLTETQIKIWFQNRRNKWKRQLAAEIEANTSGGVPSNGANVTNVIVQQQQQGPNIFGQPQRNSSNSSSNNNNNGNGLMPASPNSQQQRVVRVPVLYTSGESNNGNKSEHFRFV